jgi:hypothetical protein
LADAVAIRKVSSWVAQLSEYQSTVSKLDEAESIALWLSEGPDDDLHRAQWFRLSPSELQSGSWGGEKISGKSPN